MLKKVIVLGFFISVISANLFTSETHSLSDLVKADNDKKEVIEDDLHTNTGGRNPDWDGVQRFSESLSVAELLERRNSSLTAASAVARTATYLSEEEKAKEAKKVDEGLAILSKLITNADDKELARLSKLAAYKSNKTVFPLTAEIVEFLRTMGKNLSNDSLLASAAAAASSSNSSQAKTENNDEVSDDTKK